MSILQCMDELWESVLSTFYQNLKPIKNEIFFISFLNSKHLFLVCNIFQNFTKKIFETSNHLQQFIHWSLFCMTRCFWDKKYFNKNGKKAYALPICWSRFFLENKYAKLYKFPKPIRWWIFIEIWDGAANSIVELGWNSSSAFGI